MPYKSNLSTSQGSGNVGLTRHNHPTKVPYSPEEVDLKKTDPQCYHWSQADVDKVNALIRAGVVDGKLAVELVKPERVLELVPYMREAAIDAGRALYERYNGPFQQRRAPRKKRDNSIDLGLGFTKRGISIKPRKKSKCPTGHVVTGENAYADVMTGMQQCRECMRIRRKR